MKTTKTTKTKQVKKLPANKKYDKDYHPQEAIKYLSKGYTVRSLIGHFEVSHETFSRWRKDHPEFGEAVQIGRSKAEKFYIDLALGLVKGKKGSSSALAFLMKNVLDGWKDNPESVAERTPISITFGIAKKPESTEKGDS